MIEEPPNPPEETASVNSPRKPWLQRLLWIGIALLVMVASTAASAYLGLHYGERDRLDARHATIEAYYNDGLSALNDGQYELARANFRYVLTLEPENTLAQQGLAEAKARLAAKPTPTSEAEISLEEQRQLQIAGLFEQAQTAYEAEEWTSVASVLSQLRALNSEYKQEQVEEMLFESLRNAGMQFLDEEKLEEGIFYLDQAIALRPLDSETVNERNLAARYLSALGYWGVDWQQAVTEFEELYTIAPNYKDVFSRLYRANVAYGDYMAEQGEMCPAEIAYTEALRLATDSTVEEKRAEAAQVCLVATPIPQDGAQPVLTPQTIPGFNVGRLAYPVYNSETGFYDLYALYANGRILKVADSADQPWWEWGTGRVIYRNRVNRTIDMVLPEEGVPQQLTPPDGRAWPALSPDGQRMAYSAQNTAGVWTIYIIDTYAPGTPTALAPGWSPAWSPTGWLAYSGCEADGETCGIFVDNPDDDQPGTRLTGSINDTAVSWSPDGSLMAYMSNVTGNWDILLLGREGGVTQLTYEASDEGLPAWAPDGSGIAFVSNREGTWAIYVADPTGKNIRRIVDLGVEMPGWDNQRLSWSP
jgi:tetratricopeptide (TPR) repeat protein